MPIKTKHPEGMIDLMKVFSSRVMEDKEKLYYDIPKNHHVLIVDMGVSEWNNSKKLSGNHYQ